ncbi:MAG: hypothetical protein WC231_02960 [Dehalococcoidales bacterium]
MNLSKIIKGFHHKQNGHVFITALIILVLGTLTLTPLMGFMGTGLKTGQAFEEQTDLLYAADAGIEDAIWQIQNGGEGVIDGAPGFFDSEPVEVPVPVLGLPPYIVYEDGSDVIIVSVHDIDGELIELSNAIYDSDFKEITVFDVHFNEDGQPVNDDGDPIVVYIKVGEDFIDIDGIEDISFTIQGGTKQATAFYDTVFYSLQTNVNGSSVRVELTRLTREVYIVSATADDGEKSTTVKAWLGDKTGDYSSITDHVITTPGGIDVPGGLGTPGEDDWTDKIDISDIQPENYPSFNDWPPELWPSADDMRSYYRLDIRGLDAYTQGEIIVENQTGIDGLTGTYLLNPKNLEVPGATYVDTSGTLELKSSTDNVTLRLEDTLFIEWSDGDSLDKGKFVIPNSSKLFTLDLNGQTIFVSNPQYQDNKWAVVFSDKCTLKGPGAIVAVGNIDFQPNVDAASGGPILVMSVSGYTNFKPGPDFLGCIAGKLRVDFQTQVTLHYPENGFPPMNFPGLFSGGAKMWKLLTYEIS